MKRIKYSIIFLVVLSLGLTGRLFYKNSLYNRAIRNRILFGGPKDPKTEPELTQFRIKIYNELKEDFGFQQEFLK